MDEHFTLQQQGRQARQAGAQMLHTDECIRKNQSVLRRRGTGSRAGSLLLRAAIYNQIPDSDPAGVVSTPRDFMENFGVSAPLPHDLRTRAVRIGELWPRAGLWRSMSSRPSAARPSSPLLPSFNLRWIGWLPRLGSAARWLLPEDLGGEIRAGGEAATGVR